MDLNRDGPVLHWLWELLVWGDLGFLFWQVFFRYGGWLVEEQHDYFSYKSNKRRIRLEKEKKKKTIPLDVM